MNLEQVKEILVDGTLGYFATINNGQVELRGWQYQFQENNKFYFATANAKDVCKQMKINNQVGFACVSNGYNVRISGESTFVNDVTIKADIFSKISAGVQAMYKNVSNPKFEIFYIGSGEIKVSKGYEPFESIKF
ncbi:MAG TPA: pyridoxamine 5'-phosphate oxidase [Clostridium sp.]